MTIPQGYKQTELGIIPEDWEVKAIGSLGYTYSGLSGKKKSDFRNGNAKYIPFLNILTNTQIDTNNLESVCVSSSEHQNSVSKGDLFFNTSSETPEEVGMCAVLSKDCPNTYLNSFCFGFRPFENCLVDGVYLSYFFRGSEGRKLMSILAQGATRYNLSKTNLLESYIYIPPIAEQRAIAEALSDVDGLIAALDKKIAKKRLLKQGAMQQLLTGKKRLPGFTDEWKYVALEHLLEYEQPTKYLVQSTDYIDSGTPVLTAGKTFILGYTAETKRIYTNLPVIIFDDFTTDSKYVTMPFKAKSSAMKMLQLKDRRYNLRLVYELMQLIQFPLYDHQRYWISEYSKLQVYIPSDFEEQQAIATILSDMDKEIADLEAQRDKYRLLKSGMMQKLLTGQIRLKTE